MAFLRPEIVGNLRCDNRPGGKLHLTWRDQTLNKINLATSYLVIIRNRERTVAVQNPEFMVEGHQWG